MRILILGGTTEASALARLLAGDRRFDPILSLAGRTSAPKAQPIPTRTGGFGGVEGLKSWLRNERIVAVIDATHPFADQISAHAVAACEGLGLPLLSVSRPPWLAQPGDKWRHVPDAKAAAAALGKEPRTVFLSMGRLELAPFADAPQHRYVVRLIEPPGDIGLPPNMTFRYARGPFGIAAERNLLTAERIEIIVSKNSGGAATYAKIEAARDLGLPVIIIDRPAKAQGDVVETAEAALAWLDAVGHHLGKRPNSLRGV
jgi:precorrin-6A/cobalt-precorrin-6A reductase